MAGSVHGAHHENEARGHVVGWKWLENACEMSCSELIRGEIRRFRDPKVCVRPLIQPPAAPWHVPLEPHLAARSRLGPWGSRWAAS